MESNIVVGSCRGHPMLWLRASPLQGKFSERFMKVLVRTAMYARLANFETQYIWQEVYTTYSPLEVLKLFPS